LAVPATDDGGGIAGDGFGFQYDCIARLAIQMIRDSTVARIVCETHEDALVIYADGTAELVSCKARDPSRPYTIKSLCSDGGLLHLFNSWMHTGRTCRSHLMTEGAFTQDAQKLIEDCESRQVERVAPWGAQLAPSLSTDAALATEFLTGVRVTDSRALGLRSHTAGINASKLREWLRANGISVALDEQCYSLLREKVAECCRAAMSDPLEGTSLLEASTNPETARHAAKIANRALSAQSVSACMRDTPTGQPLLAGDPENLDHTRLVAKLDRGEVPPQVVAAAKGLRASWYEYESALSLRAPATEPGLTDVRNRTLLALGDATAKLDLTEPYGQRMYLAIRDAVKVGALGELSVLGLSDELLLGLVFQATDECELFWSSPFDVDAELE
jgi:hypothetical protein